MAIYLHNGTILTEGNAIATHADCCCGSSSSSSSSSLGSSSSSSTATTDCDSCNPPLPYTYEILIEEDVSGQFWTLDGPGSATVTGTFNLVWDGNDMEGYGTSYCYWSDYIGYQNPFYGGGPYTHYFWILRSDGSSQGGVLMAGIVETANASEPTRTELYASGFVFGYFYWGAENCSTPCAFQPQGDPETWIRAKITSEPLCTYTSNTCNSCSPGIQEIFIVKFSGLTGTDWAIYNDKEIMLVHTGASTTCVWENNAGSGATVGLSYSGGSWTIELNRWGTGSTGCFAKFNATKTSCDPTGSYPYSTQDISSCSGNNATSATATIYGDYP